MNNRTPDPGSSIPLWLTTYCDMITLLMTFFVLLQTLATVQDAGMVGRGRDSFVKRLRNSGMGVLMGWSNNTELGDDKLRSKTAADEPEAERTIDSEREVRRRAFVRIKEKMTTLPSQMTANRTEFTAVNVRFGPGQAVLNKASETALAELAVNLRPLSASGPKTLYVLGLADEGGSERAQWLLAAQRAQVVAAFLKGQLVTFSVDGESQQLWRIYSWGAGPGVGWAGQDRTLAGSAHILIAVLKTM